MPTVVLVCFQALSQKLESKKLSVEGYVRSGKLCRVKDRYMISDLADDSDTATGNTWIHFNALISGSCSEELLNFYQLKSQFNEFIKELTR